jgi:hypothetical protein
LAAIAVAVILLWACVLGERHLVRQAYAERARLLREIRLLQLQHRAIPASAPILPPTSRVQAG